MATSTTNLGLTKPSVNDAADIGVLNSNFDKIDEKCNPASFAPSGYGLGTSATYITDLNNAKENGFYHWNTAAVNAPFNPANGGGEMIVLKRNENAAHQIAYDAARENLKCVRQYSGGTWGEWEWVNPLMIPGVEYRTTERWNEKPVYTKLVDCGGLINGKNVEWRYDAVKPIRAVVTVEGRGAMPFDFGNNNAYNCHATIDGSIYLYSDGGYDGYQVYAAVWYTKD